MVVKIILAVPVIVGAILIIIGVLLTVNRTRFGIQTEGIVTGISKKSKRFTRLKMDVESPVVKYKINGQEYNCPASRYVAEGVFNFKKGDKVKIRVNRKNHRIFNLTKNSGLAELLLIGCGIFIILSYIVLYIRYF